LTKFFRRFSFGFSFLPKSLVHRPLFQISRFQFFPATCGLLSAHSVRAHGCSTVLSGNSRDFCRTISATNRTTIDSLDAYYFGNVDKIGIRAGDLRTRLIHPETPQLVSKHLYFHWVSLAEAPRLTNLRAPNGRRLSDSNELGLGLALFSF